MNDAPHRRLIVVHARLICLLCVVNSAWLSGCDAFGGPDVSDADVRFIAVEDFVNASEGVVVVDVRSERDYATAHIPGAINIPLADIFAQDARLVQAKQIVVYDEGFTDARATAAVKKMILRGYENVAEYQGGVALWKSSGRQLHTTLPPASP